MQTKVHEALRGRDEQELERGVEGTRFLLTGEESTESWILKSNLPFHVLEGH